MVPSNLGKTDHFLFYDWEEGKTLYEHNNKEIYQSFLYDCLSNNLNPATFSFSNDLIKPFYIDKTIKRKDAFLQKYGEQYWTTEFKINNIQYPSIKSLFERIDFRQLEVNPFYPKFHGDLQFDNIILGSKSHKFYYIDWRESFAGNIEKGDVYYDLSKLYGGCILPYNLLKEENYIELHDGMTVIDYSYSIPEPLQEFTVKYENWIKGKNFNLKKIKLIKSLIYLNMSPLHSHKFNLLLWCKSIEGLYECLD